jgi:hypothetical protein
MLSVTIATPGITSIALCAMHGRRPYDEEERNIKTKTARTEYLRSRYLGVER